MTDLTIPGVRARMRELAIELDCPELNALADATLRRYHGRRASVRCEALTPEKAEQVRSYCRDHPKASQMEVADQFGLNIGRVSEALYGKRG
ncbi:MAG: hypothetical protein WCP82_09585 [Alphaproteobacteria bacterium]